MQWFLLLQPFSLYSSCEKKKGFFLPVFCGFQSRSAVTKIKVGLEKNSPSSNPMYKLNKL